MQPRVCFVDACVACWWLCCNKRLHFCFSSFVSGNRIRILIEREHSTPLHLQSMFLYACAQSMYRQITLLNKHEVSLRSASGRQGIRGSFCRAASSSPHPLCKDTAQSSYATTCARLHTRLFVYGCRVHMSTIGGICT